jgi:hypothetical protein
MPVNLDRSRATTSSTSSSSSTTTPAPARDPGMMSRLKKWGVIGAIAVGLAIPAFIGVQIATAPRSPVDLHVPPPIVQTQPTTTAPVDVFVPAKPSQPTQPAIPQPPTTPTPTDVIAQPTMPDVVVETPTAPTTPVPPTPTTPEVQQPTVQTVLAQAFHDGVLDVGEAKDAVRLLQQQGTSTTLTDYKSLAASYADSRTTTEARGVLDATFVRAGVPVGEGAAHLQRLVERAAGKGELGQPLRGRLHTAQMMQLELAPSASLPRGATVWVSPGARAQAFVEVSGQGSFGPITVNVRAGS